MHFCNPLSCRNKSCLDTLENKASSKEGGVRLAEKNEKNKGVSLDIWVAVIGGSEGVLMIKCPNSSLSYATPLAKESLSATEELSAFLNDAAAQGQFLWLILMGNEADISRFREMLAPVADKRVLAEIGYAVRDMRLETIREKLSEMSAF